MDFILWRYYRKKLVQIYRNREDFYPEETISTGPNSSSSVSRTFECWHYTSMKSLINIFKDYIESKDDAINSFNLYASNIRFMNDSQEFEDGKSLYQSQVSKSNYKRAYKKMNYNADAYIISFCENGDLLSQWRGYGKESGISFCFNEKIAMYQTYSEKTSEGKTENKTSFNDAYTKPLPVIYNDDNKIEYFRKLEKLLNPCDKHEESHLDILGALFIPYCKNKSFFEEREQRLVFYTTDGIVSKKGNTISFNYVYNTFGEYVKPALNVNIKRRNANSPFNYSNEKEPEEPLITKMIVGPGANQHIVFNTLIHVFDKKNRDNYVFLNEGEEIIQNRPEDKIDETSIVYDRRVHRIRCSDNFERDVYKCSNGLIIMKSANPYRS